MTNFRTSTLAFRTGAAIWTALLAGGATAQGRQDITQADIWQVRVATQTFGLPRLGTGTTMEAWCFTVKRREDGALPMLICKWSPFKYLYRKTGDGKYAVLADPAYIVPERDGLVLQPGEYALGHPQGTIYNRTPQLMGRWVLPAEMDTIWTLRYSDTTLATVTKGDGNQATGRKFVVNSNGAGALPMVRELWSPDHRGRMGLGIHILRQEENGIFRLYTAGLPWTSESIGLVLEPGVYFIENMAKPPEYFLDADRAVAFEEAVIFTGRWIAP